MTTTTKTRRQRRTTTKKTTPLHIAATQGDLEVVKYLVEQCDNNNKNDNDNDNNGNNTNIWQQVDDAGNTALHAACAAGNLLVARYLMAYSPVPPASHNHHYYYHRHHYHHNPSHCQTRTRLLWTSKNAAGQVPLELVPSQHAAAFADLQACLGLGARNDNNHAGRRTCLEHDLTHAAYNGQLELVRRIITTNLDRDINAPSCHGDGTSTSTSSTNNNNNNNNNNIAMTTPLHVVCARGYLHLARYLLEIRHADCTVVDHQGNTPLHKAAQHGHLDLCQYLLAQEEEEEQEEEETQTTEPTNTTTTTTRTATTATKETNAVPLMHVQNVHGQTAVQVARQQGHFDVVEYLSLQPLRGKYTKQGQCLACGTQCFDVPGGRFIFAPRMRRKKKSVPLTVPGLVHNGACLVCRRRQLSKTAAWTTRRTTTTNTTPGRQPPVVPRRAVERVVDETHRLCAAFPYAKHQTMENLWQRIRLLEIETGVEVLPAIMGPTTATSTSTSTATSDGRTSNSGSGKNKVEMPPTKTKQSTTTTTTTATTTTAAPSTSAGSSNTHRNRTCIPRKAAATTDTRRNHASLYTASMPPPPPPTLYATAASGSARGSRTQVVHGVAAAATTTTTTNTPNTTFHDTDIHWTPLRLERLQQKAISGRKMTRVSY